MKPNTITGAMLMGALFLASSNASATKPKQVDPAELTTFTQCSDVRDFLAETYSRQVAQSLSYPQQQYWGGDGMLDSTGGSAPASRSGRASAKAEGSGPSGYTKTNVQEAGVDENDVVKTDGRFVYSVSGRSVTIVKSWPVKDSRVISRIELGEGITPASLFLRGDKLVVISSIYVQQHRGVNQLRSDAPRPFNGTRVSVVDVSDRTDPKIERQEDIEGWSYQSRMIGDDVYVVFNSNLRAPQSIWDLDQYKVSRPKNYLSGKQHQRFIERTERKVYKRVRKQLSNSTITELMPRRRVVRGDGRVVSSKSLVGCSDLHHSKQQSMSMIGVAHIDIDDADDFGATALLGNGWNVYASTNNLYITGTTYGWWWGQNQDDWYHTHVHKFRLRGRDGQPTYAASGKVDGWVLNQFSMSEWNGDLRIGTTDWNVPGRDGGGNHLTVLRERDGTLTQVGAVRGLAKGERIYSMRMVGDIGYMVTFRQTDPLYTIDLSNPRKPKVMGELKINGFSSYIHPLGPNHLLTVGQDADDDGRVLGLHLQIFDVSDLSDPQRIHHKRLTGERWSSWSPAMWDHHAFTFDATRKLLVLPMTSYQPEQFTGALVLQAHPKTGFKEMGFLTQTGKTGKEFCEKANTKARANNRHYYGCQQANVVWAMQIQRTIIVDDFVLAMSHYGMTAHPLNRPHRTIASVFTLDPHPTYYGYYR